MTSFVQIQQQHFLYPFYVVFLLCWLALPLRAKGAGEECSPGALKLLTGTSDGFYFALGEALQKVAGKHGLHLCAVEADQTLHTPCMLNAGHAAFGLVQSDLAHDAWYGHPTPKSPPPLCSNRPHRDTTHLVLPLYVEAVHILVRPHLSVSRVIDLKGKRVWLGPEDSGTEYTAQRVLRAAGLDPEKDITIVQIPRGTSQLNDAGKMLREMKDLDAFFRVTFMPSPHLQDVLNVHDGKSDSEIRLLDIDYDLVDRLAADGSYIPTLVPAPYYGKSRSTLTLGVQALLLAAENVDEDDVVKLAEIVRKHRSEIESEISHALKEEHGHQHRDTSLSLLNVPTSPRLTEFIHPEKVKVYLYDWWRDSIKPLLPVILVSFVVIAATVIWQRATILRTFRAQPNVFLLVGGTIVVWVIASGILCHFEWSVNENFNSFPRSLCFSFLYLIGLRGYSPLTPDGQTAAEVTKWLSVALLGGFATPLASQCWRWMTQKLSGTAGKPPTAPMAMPEPALRNTDVLDMFRSGLALEIVLLKIKTSQSAFDTSASALRELKSAGVPDAVILAMVGGHDTTAAARMSA